MASSAVLSHKAMKRLESRKSHSWWWDSHISPKNSKWLAENLEEMDRSVKRMLKLIEEDGDSFAKKAEMYYQKRPELISLVEEFYRVYRSLAERYDHVTGELRRNIPSDLQSQGSSVSDIASELPSAWPSPGPESKPSRRKSGPRAAGFDFFLGSGGSSSDLQKEGDESSTLTDSEAESDDSSVNNYSVLLGTGDHQTTRKIMELEIELREMKEKLRMQQDENGDSSSRAARNENSEYLLPRIEGYEQELKVARERIQLSQEEIARLNGELQRYKSLEFNNDLKARSVASMKENVEFSEAGAENETETQRQESVSVLEPETSDSNGKIQSLTEELRITKERLTESEKEIVRLRHQIESNIPSDKISSLHDQLALAQKDVHSWKTKLNAEKREVSKLKERVTRLKSSLADRDHEIRDLKIAVSDAEQNIFPEKAQIKAEISKLLEERKHLGEQLRESESRGRCLEDEIRMLQAEKTETEEALNSEINKLKVDICECEKSLDALRSEKDALNVNMTTLKKEVISRDNRIDQMDKHLHQLHMEHVELIAGAEEARKLVNELQSKAKDLEEEVEKQKIAIVEGAEEKREAIRQLCFSLEHYRNGYHQLREAFIGQRRVPVLAS